MLGFFFAGFGPDEMSWIPDSNGDFVNDSQLVACRLAMLEVFSARLSVSSHRVDRVAAELQQASIT